MRARIFVFVVVIGLAGACAPCRKEHAPTIVADEASASSSSSSSSPASPVATTTSATDGEWMRWGPPTASDATVEIGCPVPASVDLELMKSDVDAGGWQTISGNCNPGKRQIVPVPHGRWFLRYHGNVPVKPNMTYCDSETVDVAAGARVTWAPDVPDAGVNCYLVTPDLHCPLLLVDGRVVRAVLVDRDAPTRAGDDRVPLSALRVRGGVVEIEIAEREPETTHVDRIALEIDQRIVESEGAASFALDVGQRAALRFVVGGDDRTLEATIVVGGWYRRYEER
jgi:hypothetical protein